MSATQTLAKKKTSSSDKKVRIDVNALEAIGHKFAIINNHIENGREVPSELTTNFVTFPLSDDPFID